MKIGTAKLIGSRVLIAGLGLSGLSVSHVCKCMHIPFISFDEKNSVADITTPHEIPWDDIACMVISPGFPPSHYLVQQAHTRNIPIWSEVEFAWHVRIGRNPRRLRLLQNKGFFSFAQDFSESYDVEHASFLYSPAPWIGITGTNGKTTTTEMISAILQEWGLHAPAVGNIGVSLSEAVRNPDNDVLCVELSSFALHFTSSMRLDTAVWLNVAEDHLDWHGGFENYWKDKAKIFNNKPPVIIFNAQDPIISKYIFIGKNNKTRKNNKNDALKINTKHKKMDNKFTDFKPLGAQCVDINLSYVKKERETKDVYFTVGITSHRPLPYQIGVEKDSIAAYDILSYYSMEHSMENNMGNNWEAEKVIRGATTKKALEDYCLSDTELIPSSARLIQKNSIQKNSFSTSELSHVHLSTHNIMSVKGLSSALCDSQKRPYLHLLMDAIAAASVGYMYGVPNPVIYRTLHAFRPEAHRLEYIQTINRVTYVDDSKATNPHAAKASLKSFPAHSVVWIAGGLTKDVDIYSFIEEIKDYLAATIIIGRDPCPFSEALMQIAPQIPMHIISPYSIAENTSPQQYEVNKEFTSKKGFACDGKYADIKKFKSGQEVMKEALEVARSKARPGQVVLLAPAAASMDQFKNYGERGRLFSLAVKDLS